MYNATNMGMSKAFNKINHKILIKKLKDSFGISGNLLYWLQSYLMSNRKQRVTVLGATSSARSVLSGVPQGSILGPVLFLLYVNDLPNAVHYSIEIASFADDTKVFKQIDSFAGSLSLQCDLNSLENWLTSSGFVFNQEKCRENVLRAISSYSRVQVTFQSTVPKFVLIIPNYIARFGILRWNIQKPISQVGELSNELY